MRSKPGILKAFIQRIKNSSGYNINVASNFIGQPISAKARKLKRKKLRIVKASRRGNR